MNKYDVIHAWAWNEDQCWRAGTVSRQKDGTLYSYSTCIGQRIEWGENVIFLLNTTNYSSYTSQHQQDAYRAVPLCGNVCLFEVSGWNRGVSDLVRLFGSDENKRKAMLRFGVELFVLDYFEQCKSIAKSKKLDISVNPAKGYEELERWFEATKVSSVSKLLKMKSDEFNKIIGYHAIDEARRIKSYLKALSQGKGIEELCDIVNGKGAWQKYLDRTAGLRLAKKHRKWSEKLYFSTPSTEYKYNDPCPVVEGSVTKKSVEKHRKAGDLIKWMLSLKKANYIAANDAYETRQGNQRREKAKEHLEIYIGLRGWTLGWSPFGKAPKRYFSRFDYDGTVITFANTRCYEERKLTDEEYTRFRQMTAEEQKTFIHERRLWMVQQLQQDTVRAAERERYLVEQEKRWAKEAEERRKLEETNKAHIEELKAQGDSGYRQLYHEGFNVNVYGCSSAVFYGGNVLLRFNKEENLIETSKYIKITVEVARKLWAFIERCHANGGANVKGFEIPCINHTYTVHSYENDILTAGCHRIAYQEMAYMAKELGLTA